MAHIDFADMRARTGIPEGDLFTVMEAWREERRIAAAMDVILAIEAEAATRVSLKPGCIVRGSNPLPPPPFPCSLRRTGGRRRRPGHI